MFDLPSKTKKERRIYRRFRKVLLQYGFVRLQFSVYLKAVAGTEQAETIRKNIIKKLPPQGNIRILPLSDTQYAKMETYNNSTQQENEIPSPDFIVF
jgi:CRISPR-associated protein Cas2